MTKTTKLNYKIANNYSIRLVIGDIRRRLTQKKQTKLHLKKHRRYRKKNKQIIYLKSSKRINQSRVFGL